MSPNESELEKSKKLAVKKETNIEKQKEDDLPNITVVFPESVTPEIRLPLGLPRRRRAYGVSETRVTNAPEGRGSFTLQLIKELQALLFKLASKAKTPPQEVLKKGLVLFALAEKAKSEKGKLLITDSRVILLQK